MILPLITLLGLDSYVFRNFLYENTMGRLYGLGGGQGAGQNTA
jgi:hypothetical protein